MSTWTIFDSPDDAPGFFVVRRFLVTRYGAVPTQDVARFVSLAAARASLPPGLACLPRDRRDHPSVTETWL